MKQKNIDWIEDKVNTAEMQYRRMMTNIDHGIIDRNEIAAAMEMINIAHKIAIHKNRRELIK
jgi:hypothetical protein